MPNKNYNRGRALEYKVRKQMEKDGYHVIRSAGSHGIFDLICIDLNSIRCIQLKMTDSQTPASKYNQEIRAIGRLMFPVNCRKEMWFWSKRWKKWRKEVID